MSPTLSIITITYNAPETLEATLESLRWLESAPISWEHVIVDSSPEKNQKTLEKFQSPRRRIVVQQPPRGIYAAMNAGIESAKGEVVWFLNGGDKFATPSPLEEILNSLQEHSEPAMAMAAAELIRDGEHHFVQHPRRGIFPMLGINRVCHQAVLYKKSVFEKLGMFSEKYRLAADYELHLRALEANIPTIYFDKIIVRYDMGGRSSDFEKVFSEFAQIHKDLSKTLKNVHLHQLVWSLELARVRVFKSLGATPAGPALRKLWQKMHR